MSHFKGRKEKNCLNCGAEVAGRYCQVCGQENVEPKESFWHLIVHFFNDITHYDGKFLSTVKYLLLRPGFLTIEYTRGKRMTYLHPIRMYVFTSAFFFLIFFSFISKNDYTETGLGGLHNQLAQREEELARFKQMSSLTSDLEMLKAIDVNISRSEKDIDSLSARIIKEGGSHQHVSTQKVSIADSANSDGIEMYGPAAAEVVDSIREAVDAEIKLLKTDTTGVKSIGENEFMDFEFYKDEATYKAIQRELPPDRQDGMAEAALKLRLLHWHDQQAKDGKKAFNALLDRFKHSFPTILFISLPIFAFLLKLLYIRKGKFYYADHGIFAIHTYCAMFIFMLLYYIFDGLDTKWQWSGWEVLKTGVVVYMIYYAYKAMHNYYAQGRGKTILKYILLSWFTLIIMTCLIVIFFIISATKN